MTALLGINALRRGEQDNCIGCVGPSSCIFPIARRGRPHQAVGLARGGRMVLGVSRRMARRPAYPLAAQHRRHDARRLSGQGPASLPDPGRPVPLQARPRAVRERRDQGRPDRAGARPGRRLHLRRLHRRRPPRYLHDLVRRRPWCLAVRQPRRRPFRRPLGARPGSTIRSMP